MEEVEDGVAKRRASQVSSHAGHVAKARNVNTVQFGEYEIDCWYYSDYPFMLT